MRKAFEMENLYRLQKSDIKKASVVAARAFNEESVIYNTLIPDVNERLLKLPYTYSLLLRYGLKNGEIYSPTEEIEGFSIWLPHNKIDINFWSSMRNGGLTVYRKLGGYVIKEIMRSSAFNRNMHEKIITKPHWYLQFLAIDPQYQGKSYASMLMKPMIARADKEGLPIYLETQNERNVSIYQHFGFKIMKKGQNPNWDITNWGMLWEPKNCH